MLATLRPLFDEKMAVRAYSILARKGDILLNPLLGGTAGLDGAGNVAEFEIVNSMGLSGLAGNREVFVPVNHFAMFTELREQCNVPYKKVVLLMDNSILPDEEHINRIKQLRDQGFKIAFRKIAVENFAAYQEIFRICDYVMFDFRKVNMPTIRAFFAKLFPKVQIVATSVDTQVDFDELKEQKSCELFIGDFFSVPVIEEDVDVSPVKANYIQLLNVINKPDFDLTDAAEVIGHDAALVIALLKKANPRAFNSEVTSVQHAAAILGQDELKRWINTAVTRELCTDKPSEITRISLLRARFCELLAPLFHLSPKADELYLMGLFSVLDVMLDKSMEDALEMVKVSEELKSALLRNEGELAQVLTFMRSYEEADWIEISRRMMVGSISEKDVYQAYLDGLAWYRDVVS